MLSDFRHELRELCPKLTFFEITGEICDLAARVAPTSRLRTLDAIHLATFLRARQLEPTTEMLTFDERLVREL